MFSTRRWWPIDFRRVDAAPVPTNRDWHHDRAGYPGSRELLARVLYRNPRRILSSIES
jgi:hypothetical protein